MKNFGWMFFLLVCAGATGRAQDTVATTAERHVQVELNASYESLTHGYAPWRSLSLDISKKLADRRVLYGSLRETSRFSLRDQEVMGGLYFPLGKRWLAQVEASVSPSHRVLAKWSALGQIGRELGRGWVAQVGLRRTAYHHTSANLSTLSVERYWQKYRAAYTLYVSQQPGTGVSTSHSLQANYYYRERNAIGVTVAAGQELTNLGPRGLLRSEVRGLALTGRHGLNQHWALSYDLNWNRQGDIYTKRGVRFGVRYNF
jgi:YaiO family outer membrane protein